MIRNMLKFVKTSQQNLKSRLQEFGWKRQIKLWKDTAKNVRNIDEANLREFFVRKIGVIETGDMKFVSWCGHVLREVEKFGTLSWSNKTEKPDRRKSGTNFWEFDSPTGIAADGDRIIVSDRNNQRIQVFGFMRRFIHSQKGSIAQFCLKPDFRLRGLAFKSDNSLLVADGRNRCVLFIDKFLKTAVKFEGFLKTQSAACNRNEIFAVFDSGNKTIKVFDDYGNLYRSLIVEEFGS